MHFVFIHGFLGCKEDFLPLMKHFEKIGSYQAFDLPSLPSVDDYIEFIAQKIEKKCTLIGYSMGGRLALQFAEKHPEKIERLIIISSHLGLMNEEEKQKRFQEDLKLSQMLKENPFEVFLKKWYDGPLFASLKEKKQIFDEMMERRKKQDPLALAKMLEVLSLGKQESLWDVAFDFPVLFIAGEKDEKYKTLYQKLNALILPNAGHAPHLECPKELFEAIYGSMERKAEVYRHHIPSV